MSLALESPFNIRPVVNLFIYEFIFCCYTSSSIFLNTFESVSPYCCALWQYFSAQVYLIRDCEVSLNTVFL